MAGRLLYRQSKIEERLGGNTRSLAWATRARTVLFRAEDPRARSLAAVVAAWYASVLQGLGRTRDSAKWARLAIVEGEPTGNHRALADAYDVLDTLNLMLGLPTGTYWEKALALFEEIGAQRAQQRVLGNLGAGCYAEGRWDEAMRFNERAHELAVRIGDVVSGGFDLINMGEIAGDRGELEEAEALLRESLRIWRASEYSFPLGGCLAYLGRVVARAGRADEALRLYAEALEAFEKAGAHEEAVEVRARIAECLTFQVESEAALARLDEVSAQPGAAGMFAALIHRVRGYALAQLHQRARAREEFEASLSVSRSRGSDYDVVQALIGLIRLATIEGKSPPPELVEETSRILERLHIRAVTHVPLLP
jgi:tetratricopeptide (TPR) repeat protein